MDKVYKVFCTSLNGVNQIFDFDNLPDAVECFWRQCKCGVLFKVKLLDIRREKAEIYTWERHNY